MSVGLFGVFIVEPGACKLILAAKHEGELSEKESEARNLAAQLITATPKEQQEIIVQIGQLIEITPVMIKEIHK